MMASSSDAGIDEGVVVDEHPEEETIHQEGEISSSSGGADADNGNAITHKSSKQETPAPTQQQQQAHDSPPQRFLQAYARRMALRPYLHLFVAFAIAIILSVVGMVFGDFSVAVNNEGWVSRGTKIADRSTQLKMVDIHYQELFYDRTGELWRDLMTNVQPGWEGTDEDDWRRTRRNLMSIERGSGALSRDSSSSILQGYVQDTLERRMQQQNVTFGGALEGCDISWYTSGEATRYSHLWPIWKAKSPSKTSILDAQAIHDICVAEQNTKKMLQDANQCYGCPNGACLPPLSIVFFAHLTVEDYDIALSCEELKDVWTTVADQAKADLTACVQAINLNYKNLDDALENSCPFGFSTTQVDEFFGQNGQELLQYSSSIFSTVYENDAQALYDLADDYDRAEWSDSVIGAYDTQNEDLIELYYDQLLGRDMTLAICSAAVVVVAMIVHTRSPWITVWGLLQIVLSFPLSFFVYSLIAGLQFFPFLNFIGIFVVFALGADDVFVAVDKWKNARLKHRRAPIEVVAVAALPDAATSMFLTSITTAIAFFATAICPVAPLRAFAVFCGLLIIFDYLMCVFLVFPAICLYDRWKEAGSRNCCVSCHCCRRIEAGNDETGFGDELDIHSDPSQWSFIHRLLLRLYQVIHRFRWVLFAAIIGGLVASIITTLKMGLPESNDVRLMDEDQSQFEQNFQWRKNILADVLSRQEGSQNGVIWGSRPADTGDHWNPASWTQLTLDDGFDPSSQAAQEHLVAYCDTFFENDWAERISDDYECPINAFDTWLQEQSVSASPSEAYLSNCEGATSLPMSPESFHSCMIAWSQLVVDPRVLQLDGKVRLLTFTFRSEVRFDSPYDLLDDTWHGIESWMNSRRKDGPEEVRGAYFSSDHFWWYDVNGSMLRTAYAAAGIALGAAAAVVLFSSRSFIITLFSVLTIAFVLTSVTAILYAAGWTLGFLESICFAILIGVSVDFVIHFGHAYSSLPGDVSRHDRTKYALISMGPSILAAAFTTIVSAIVMFFCTISFFTKFATMLFFTIIMATCGSFVVFITLTDLFGPSQPTYLVERMGAWAAGQLGCCQKDEQDEEDNDERDQKEVTGHAPQPLTEARMSSDSSDNESLDC